MKRIVVVHSGHGFSTYDVGVGLAAGLRANGVAVFEYPLHDTLETAELLINAAKLCDLVPPRGLPDARHIGAMGIPGFVMAHQADAVLFVHGRNVPVSIPMTLRRGGYPTALICTESPYETEAHERAMATQYDVTFTCDRAAVALFTESRPGSVHYLPHAWNPERHTPDGEKADPCDVFFVGTRYPERDALLNGVDWSGIHFVDRSLDYQRTDIRELMPSIMDNAAAAAHYRSAAISINVHRTTAINWRDGHIAPHSAESLNPRAYEVPACGGFLISDERAELRDVFGDSVPTFNDSASLERVIRYYLDHPNERAELARQQYQAVQNHSWTQRAATVLAHL
jgi:spore maturation protein CgeB